MWKKHILQLLLTPIFGLMVSTTAQSAAAPESRGYNADLSGFAYPFPVKYFWFSAQEHTCRMAYMVLDADTPNGETVILLHGKNFSGAYWKATATELANAGYRVIMPDQLGFGKSSKPIDFQYSFHALSQYTAALLDKLDVNKATVVGHSMGGMLATRFALMFPQRTSALVLVNPIGLEDYRSLVPYVSVDKLFQRNIKATPEGVKSYMKKNYFDGQWKPAYDLLLEIQAGWARGPDHAHISKVSALHYDMIYTQPVVHEFPNVQAPTLVVIGQRDRTALGKGDVPPGVVASLGNYPKLGRATAKSIPNAKLVEVDDVGHVPQVEAFNAWINGLKSFLSESLK